MQEGKWNEIEPLGAKLNNFLDCPVSFSGSGGNNLWCRHELSFPIQKLLDNSNWDWVKEKHKQWLKKRR